MTYDGAGTITITNAGLYEISFIAAANETSQLRFGLSVNGTPNNIFTYGQPTSTLQVYGQGLITLAAGDTIALVNLLTSSPTVGIAGNLGAFK